MTEPLKPSPQSFPVKAGSVPTPDGVFPVDLHAGKRRRKPHIDVAAADKAAHESNRAGLLETAWGIIANAHAGNWESASPEWVDAAVKWRDAYFASPSTTAPQAVAAVEVVPGSSSESTANLQSVQTAIEKPPGTFPSEEFQKAAGALAEEILAASSYEEFIGMLAKAPELAVHFVMCDWDRDDDTVLQYAEKRWAELHPLKPLAEVAPAPVITPAAPATVDPEDAAEVAVGLGLPAPVVKPAPRVAEVAPARGPDVSVEATETKATEFAAAAKSNELPPELPKPQVAAEPVPAPKPAVAFEVPPPFTPPADTQPPAAKKAATKKAKTAPNPPA